MEKEEKYNRIVLIGNGFDKALGLKTSYLDFIIHFLKESIINAINNIKSDLLPLELKTHLSSGQIAYYTSSTPDIKTIKELSTTINNLFSVNYYEFLNEIIEHYSSANWVDIEQHYYKSLKTYYQRFKNNVYSTEVPDTVIELNKCMDLLSIEVSKYINEQQNKYFIDSLDTPLATLFDNFRNPLHQKRSNLVKRHQRKDSPENVLFLNFNYTNTVQQILKNEFWSGVNHHHIHIHGNVNYNSNPIIFGYGDDTGDIYKQLETEGENEWLRIIKSFQYPRTHNYHNLLNFLYKADFDVFIVGHSCGLSDKTLLKTIFEHDKCLAIQNFHYKGEEEDFNKRMQISRHFSDKALMRQRVLPFDRNAIIPQVKSVLKPIDSVN